MDPVFNALRDDEEVKASHVNASLTDALYDNHAEIPDTELEEETVISSINGNRLGDRRITVAVMRYKRDRFGIIHDTRTDSGGWAFPPGRRDAVVDTIAELDGFIITQEPE